MVQREKTRKQGKSDRGEGIEAMEAQGLGPDCKWIIGGMSAAVIGLCGAVAYCANGWLKSVLTRVSEKEATIAQLNAAGQVVQKKRGESPS